MRSYNRSIWTQQQIDEIESCIAQYELDEYMKNMKNKPRRYAISPYTMIVIVYVALISIIVGNLI